MQILERYGALLEEEYAALLGADEARLLEVVRRTTELLPLLAVVDPQAAPERLRALAELQRRNARLIAERLAELERRAAFFWPGRTATYDRAGTLSRQLA
jgi:hypothetical protein